MSLVSLSMGNPDEVIAVWRCESEKNAIDTGVTHGFYAIAREQVVILQGRMQHGIILISMSSRRTKGKRIVWRSKVDEC